MYTLSVSAQKDIFCKVLAAATRWQESVQLIIPHAVKNGKSIKKKSRKGNFFCKTAKEEKIV